MADPYSQIVAALTEAPEPNVQYWQALGRFIEMFSLVESVMQFALWNYARTPVPTARAIFSGVRVKEAMGLIRRIFDIEANSKDTDTKSDLEKVFNQLTTINGLRNDLIHHGSQDDGEVPEGRIISNELWAITPERLRTTPISPEILNDLTFDLVKIIVHLISHHTGRFLRVPLKEPMRMEILSAPWRYKPPQQAPRQQKKRGNSPMRRRQPAASRG